MYILTGGIIVDMEKIREVVKKAETLHKEFQKVFLGLYSLSSNWSFEELRDVLSSLYSVIERKFEGDASRSLQENFKKTNTK